MNKLDYLAFNIDILLRAPRSYLKYFWFCTLRCRPIQVHTLIKIIRLSYMAKQLKGSGTSPKVSRSTSVPKPRIVLDY